ncbi:MAG: hypothetical protein PUC61_06415 [Bacteroidales bacterium]|nr:hypothetical protein [Bacteroidales bacterium]
MIKKAIFLLTTAMTLLLAGCTKENRKTTIERQWVGEIVIDEEVGTMPICIDLGTTEPENMILAINAGKIKKIIGDMLDIDINNDKVLESLGSLGNLSGMGEFGEFIVLLANMKDDDYVYSDYTTIPYTLTYTGNDTGTISFDKKGLTEGLIIAEFKDLTKTSVTIIVEDEALELTAAKKELVKIKDSFFKIFF